MTLPSSRIALFDPIRIFLTLLVIIHHASITYGGSGDWYYKEAGAPEWTYYLLSILTSTNQSFFMGFFFLIAGYFTPKSLARKGETAYLGERLWRLGFPMLIFGYLLEPLTGALSLAAQGRDFWASLQMLFANNTFGIGPLWFNQALILFAVAWCFAPRFRFDALVRRWPRNFHVQVALLALLTSLFAFALRLGVPVGHNLIGMQIGYFASYIVLFVAGALTAQTQLLENISWKQAKPWMVVSLLVFPSLWIFAALGGAFDGDAWRGGWNIPALAYASWEPFLAAGIILGLLAFFRNWSASASAWSRRLGEASFIAFVIHAPVTVAASWLVRDLSELHLVRFLLAAPLACLASFLIADGLTRALVSWKMKRSASS